MPWLITGDFNSVLQQDDRIGGNPVSMSKITDFHKSVVECGLLELPYYGSRYTWNDKQGEYRIWSKIDWALVNMEWIDIMPDYKVKFLPEGVSDHNPIHLELKEAVKISRRAFKYCNTWSKHQIFFINCREYMEPTGSRMSHVSSCEEA